MVIAPVLVSPKARGQVWLRSADPAGQAADHHQHALRARRRRVAARRACELAREIAAQSPLREIVARASSSRGPGCRRPRGARSRPAPAPDADLPPGGHRADERHRRSGRRRLPAARARPAGPARGRRVDHADDRRRQHERTHDHDRREGPPTLDHGGRSVSVQRQLPPRGSGPPLVLLHGVGHQLAGWRPVIERLRDEFDVIACDTPGFGRSPPLPAGIEPTITSLRGRVRVVLRRARPRAPARGGQLDGRRDRARAGPAQGRRLGHRVLAGRLLEPTPSGASARLSLRRAGGLAEPAARGAAAGGRAHARRAHRRCSAQTFGYPRGCRPRRRSRRCGTRGLRPSLAETLAAFDDYTLRGSRSSCAETPRHDRLGQRDRLLPYRLQAPRARALLPWAHPLTLGAGHVPFYDDPRAVAEAVRSSAV